MLPRSFIPALGLLAISVLSRPAGAYPPAGRDAFDSAAIVRVALPALSFPETDFTAVGPARIRRWDPYDPGDGRIKIDTEIEHMVLSSDTPLGPAVIRVIGPAPGCVQQQVAGQDFPADSWFDLMVEIEVQSPFGPIKAFSDPETPIRMMATIDALPPLDAQYQPDATFAGVNLVDEGGNVVGFMAHVGHFVGQQPTFSVAPQGPSGLDPGDLFERATAPAIRAAQLGLSSGDVDGLSYGQDFVFPQSPNFPSIMDIRFSVAAGSSGRTGSAVNREATKSPPQAHGDEFRVTPFAGLGGGSNVQVLDEDGDTAPPYPLQVSDDVDALTEHPPSFVDDGDGVPEGTVFLSLSAGSPELAGLGASGATILQSTGGGPPSVFLSHADLGLTASDDIDAFCLSERTRDIVFSLAPGSPSLAGASAADLFMVLGAPGSFFPWATAANLGLLPQDDVNALKCHVGEIALTWNGKMSMDVLEEGSFVESIELACHIDMAKGSFDGEAGPSGNLPFVMNVDCAGMSSRGLVTVRDRKEPPGGLVTGVALGNQGPDGRFVGPVNGGFGMTPSFTGFGITRGHGQNPLSFFFQIPGGSPLMLHYMAAGPDSSVFEEDDSLEPPQASQLAPYALFLEGGIPTAIAIENVMLEWDGRARPSFTSEGFLDAAGFGASPSRGALASLFGTFETDTEIAGAIPLPRRAGNNVRVLFESETSLASLSEEDGGGVRQGATTQVPAPLLFTAPTQINMQIPWEARVEDGMATATVIVDGAPSAPVQLPVADTSPGVFTADFGAGRAIAINPDGTLAQPQGSLGASRPALPGETLVLLVTGLGDTTPGGVTGANSFDPDGTFVRRDTDAQVTVTIGGVSAPVVFAGLSPEFVGVYQINATVPEGVAPGDAVALVVEVGGRQSRADVTIAVGAAQ